MADSPIDKVYYVKNMDIADIKVRMEAEIKLEAYSYNKYGTVKWERSGMLVPVHLIVK